MGSPREKLFFLHVPKTGGATLSGSIGNRFAERDCLLYYQLPQPDLRELDRFRYVTGHFPLGFIDRFEDPPFIFTIVRDPIERALSAYSFYGTRPPGYEKGIVSFGLHPGGRAAEAMQLARESSLEEFIERAPDLATYYFGSRQARALDGSDPEGGEERLDDALRGLARCDFVGLTEQLDDSTELLMRRLGWASLSPLPRINVTTERLRRDEVSAAALEALCELASVDVELHRHASQRFERELAASGRSRDPSVSIPDAAPVADLRFDQPITGTGWVGRDRIGDGPPFCWIGHTNTASVELARPRGARSLRVEIAHVLEQSILGSLRISLDGTVVRHRLSEENGLVVATAPLARAPRLSRRRPVRVTLEVDRAVQPRDVNPESEDDRLLSIAVQRIAALDS